MTRRNTAVTAALAAIVLCSTACHKKQRVAAVPPAPRPAMPASRPAPLPIGYTEEGVASWYGVPYHGRPAADGEIYDMETLVAAHRVMPFNTWVRVTNLSNNKSVVVRIIDRGPFVDGRIIDLSRAAARQIDLLGPGIGRVKVEVIAAPPDIASNDFYAVQIGAFSVYANADRLRSMYAQQFGSAELALKQGPTPLWRVLIGKERSIQGAQQLADQFRAQGKKVFVVRLDQTLPTPTPAPPVSAEQRE